MYLSRLEIFGFKTFAQKVDLRFDAGITNIVGPNGCGKSNIVDALRWSLGEQKSSVLRSEKMENVIFNGTKLRKPLSVAEVSLTIQNTKGVLPTEYSEVTITRRIYRSGESEYYLNRLPCRLKDINDLFMDTGMGADAYSVIELKMVEQILSDNTDDRRKLFEEAAGITKYKIRRRQTFRKLDTTKADLMRANDIIAEIEKKVNSLKRQTQKANRYNRLMARLKYEDVRLSHHEFAALRDRMAPIETRLVGLESEAEKLLGEVTRFEADVEARQTVLIGREQKLREIQLELEQCDREIKSIEEEVLVSRERRNNLNDLIRRYGAEKNTLLEKNTSLNARAEELVRQIAGRRESLEMLTSGSTERKVRLDQVESALEGLKATLESRRKEIVSLIDTIATKRSSYQLTRANIQNLERKIGELTSAIASFSAPSKHADIDRLNKAREESNSRLDELRRTMENRQAFLEKLRSEVDSFRSEKLHGEADLRTIEGRMAILEKAIESHEGFPEGVRYLLSDKPAGIRSTLADSVTVDEKYRKAVETALGDSFSHLIAGELSAVRSALEKLRTSNKGNATFVNTSKLGASPGAIPDDLRSRLRPSVLGFASDLVRSEEKSLVHWVLGDVAIVESFEQATSLAEEFPSVRFVTLGGEMTRGNFLIRGGGAQKTSAGLIGQRDALQQLQKEAGDLRNQLRSLEDKLASHAVEIQKTTTDVAGDQQRLKSAESEALNLDKALAQAEYELHYSTESASRNEAAIGDARREMDQLRTLLSAADPELFALDEKRAALEVETRQLEKQADDLEKERKEKAAEYQLALSDQLRLEGEVRNDEASIESCRSQIADNDATIVKHEQEAEAARLEIERLTESSTQRESQLAETARRRETIEKNRDEAAQETARVKDEVGKIEGELKKIRRQREDLLNSRHSLEQEFNDLRFEIRSLTERVQRDYDFDLTKDSIDRFTPGVEAREESEEGDQEDEAAATEQPLEEVLESDLPQQPVEPGFDRTAATVAVDDLRRKIKMLGPVNMEAFDEYKTEKERLDTLVQQRQDLLDAEAQLMQTIETINETAQKQFMEVFNKIRENFIKIFTGLFEGGEADLKLADNEDLLEASIDILARPTGKKIQHIALLSGGEKTLTAIALLFAIYLVKPSPFCILDEVDAPLDDTNIDKFTKILRDFSKDTQFIVVTHNKRTMEAAQNIFGITMQEAGISKVVSVKFNNRDTSTDDIEELINRNQVEVLSQEVKDPPTAPASN